MEHLPPALGLDALVTEVSERLHAVAAVNDRMRELLEAVVSVSSGLDLHTTLRRIAGAAADLADAEYAAVGVVPGPDGRGTLLCWTAQL
ncbi:hypothetical protein [Streptacidiphilus sp. EB103A]|uniref:hypothetical protein n=1 Tax=Streptacidiphilus sp. EB103A TaxID=3156275 RepID=UPI003519597A